MYSHLFCVVVSMNEMKTGFRHIQKSDNDKGMHDVLAQSTIYSLTSHSRLCNLQVLFHPPSDTLQHNHSNNDDDGDSGDDNPDEFCSDNDGDGNDGVKSKTNISEQEATPLRIDKPTSQSSLFEWFTGVYV